MNTNLQSQDHAHPSTLPTSFDIPTNLTSLTLRNINSDIELPKHLQDLTIHFEDTLHNNILHNPAQITNLNELSELKTLSLTGSNNVVNISDHPHLISLILNYRDIPSLNDEVVVKVRDIHTSLRELIHKSRNLSISPEFVPYLTHLHVNRCDKDINSLCFLEDLSIAINIGNEIRLENFHNLKHLNVNDPMLDLSNVELPNLITMIADNVNEISESLYPNLDYCKIKYGSEDVCNIDHDKLSRLNITWDGEIRFRNMRNLKVLKIRTNDSNFLNEDECGFSDLEHLKMSCMKNYDNKIIEVDMDRFSNLRKLIVRWDIVDISGCSDNLKELDVKGLHVSNKWAMINKFPNLEKLVIDGEDEDVDELKKYNMWG